MPESLEDRFQNLHEFIKAARTNLNRNVWDYLIGGSETETTVARNRMALDAIAFRPRVLCDVTEIDHTALTGGCARSARSQRRLADRARCRVCPSQRCRSAGAIPTSTGWAPTATRWHCSVRSITASAPARDNGGAITDKIEHRVELFGLSDALGEVWPLQLNARSA
jgi:hypothetical protein